MSDDRRLIDKIWAHAFQLRDRGVGLNLDITWQRDQSLEDLDHLPAAEILASEIVGDLNAALEEFAAVAAAPEVPSNASGS
ncbi:hypothetical protein [Isoptericola variabilis]|uniref:hypothetical protein n=1 Tax=Isoptericola variabilis TaxID=139208 RepID=UPI000674E105|nr:hypothetical protein [Isoptericola variabilis]TWH35092.1 hypothetical protein L600_000100000960 [Isoptericola variabilis J7]